MKKVLLLVAALCFAVLTVAGCGSSTAKKDAPKQDANKKVVVKIGATAVPHAEILNFIKPQLKAQGAGDKIKQVILLKPM